jgi:hypothetical protein
MMGATQSRDCERFSHWLVFSPPTNATAAKQATVFFLQEHNQQLSATIPSFAIRGLMPVIYYFKFISQSDDSEYQKTSDRPQFLQTNN